MRLIEEMDKSSNSLAKDIGVSPQTLHKWVEKFGTNNPDIFPSKGNLRPFDKEKKALEKRIKALEAENLILKKAMAIFSWCGK